MTEQQANSPIDDLFRNTFENLPDSPAESGWDTPSDAVWQHIQANISSNPKGWALKSLLLMGTLLVAVVAGLYLMIANPEVKQTEQPMSAPPVETPVVNPAPSENAINQTSDTAPKPSPGSSKSKASQGNPTPANGADGIKNNPGKGAAQPLPGSKTTLPPNSTEAEKKKSSGN
ncbi:MAG: hypothetical protein ACKVT2_00315 [Saprospiraceae bacterium]